MTKYPKNFFNAYMVGVLEKSAKIVKEKVFQDIDKIKKICYTNDNAKKRREFMNFKKVQKELTDLFNKKMGLEFTYKVEDDILEARQNLTLYGRQNPVECTLLFFNSGAALFSFVLDEMPYSVEALDCLTKFNREVMFFKASIGAERLTLFHEVYLIDEKNIVDYVKGIIGFLVSDEVEKRLKPLFKIGEEYIQKMQAPTGEEEEQA